MQQVTIEIKLMIRFPYYIIITTFFLYRADWIKMMIV